MKRGPLSGIPIAHRGLPTTPSSLSVSSKRSHVITSTHRCQFSYQPLNRAPALSDACPKVALYLTDDAGPNARAGRASRDRRSARQICLCHVLSRALIGWFELASFDFCLSQHSIGTRKAQLPFAILLVAHLLRALLAPLSFRQTFPCFWCHCSLIHSPMDLDSRRSWMGAKTATRESLS
jgi:hypothetical protein